MHLLPPSVIIILIMDLDLESVSGLEDPIRETEGLLVGRRSRYSSETLSPEHKKGFVVRSELRPRDRRASGGAGSVVSSREVMCAL